jgi:hypothetical protein
MKPQIIFGPYFTSAPLTGELGEQGLQLLGLVCEWAGPNTTSRIDLLRYHPRASGQCRLEHLVFPADQSPCCLRCYPCQIVQSAGTTYLPLEALILQLYRTCNVRRPIFTVLADLASLVPLHSSVSRPVTDTGLLVAPAEAQGFRLNTVLCRDHELFTEIAWQPNSQSCRFHVCICRFESGNIDSGCWKPPGLLGVSQLLADPLHQLGRPATLFTPAGCQLLLAQLSQPAVQV